MRAFVPVLVGLVLCLGGARGDDKKSGDNKNKGKGKEATITKVDPKAHTVTVKMKDKSGKDTEKTFKLTEEVRYADSTGKAVAVDVFRSGDYVLVVEEGGRLKELRKNDKGSSGAGTTRRDK